MSWETQSWAAKQRPGSASAKLVLLGLASCADANHCAFPSIQWLCDFSDLNRKTVIAALQRLEDGMFPLIEDTGERRGRTLQVKVYRLAVNEHGREPGAQTHYVYRLINPATRQYYIGVRSFIGDPVLDGYSGSGNWPVAMKAAGVRLDKIVLAVKDSRDEACVAEALAIRDCIGDPLCMNIEYKHPKKSVPETGLFNSPETGTVEDGKSPVFSRKQSQNRDTEPFLEPLPPSSPDGEDTPAAGCEDGFAEGSLWEPPATGALGPKTRALVGQWPPGAFEAVCETFRLHWQAEGTAKARKRLASKAALEAWLIKDHAKIMRDAKAGVSFAGLVPAISSRGKTFTQSIRPVAAKAKEDERSSAVHAALRHDLGAQIYDHWIAPAAVIADDDGVTLIAASEFARSWIEDRFRSKIAEAARAMLGPGAQRVRVEVEHSSSEGSYR